MQRSASSGSLLPPNSNPGRRQQPPPHVVLYVVRHGESTGNREGVLQGQMEFPLTDVGRAQAAAAGRWLRAEAEEALASETAAAAAGTDTPSSTSSSGGNSGGSGGSSPMGTDPPLPVSFFHRVYSSDLGRARQTAELMVRELIRPSAASKEKGSSGAGGGEDGVEGLIRFDRDLREILGGVREGRRLGTSVKEATRRAAREQGVPLDAFIPPPHETAKDLRRRARRFVEKVLTDAHATVFNPANTTPTTDAPPTPPPKRSSGFPSALMLTSPFRKGGQQEGGQEGGGGGGEGGKGVALPLRILVVSHGGLLLQMFQKVFNLHAVTRVLNASLTVVEATLPSTNKPHHHTHHTTTTRRRRLALIFASPHSSRASSSQLQEQEEEEGEGSKGLAAATVFRPVRINDVAHLEALRIVTTKSTAL